MLTVTQQAQAALSHVKHALQASKSHAYLLEDQAFVDRLDMNFVTIYGIQSELYGYRADCLASLVELVTIIAESWQERPDHLRKLDKKRELEPEWFQSNDMLGECWLETSRKRAVILRLCTVF
jgi:amylosucrase